MSHRNARLTFHGRCLVVERVRVARMPVAHVAKAMGISRQCAHRWLARFDAEGLAGLEDRSSRPHRSPRATGADQVAAILEARWRLRQGPVPLSLVVGVPARTISRVLAREGVPRLCELDPLTGARLRTRATANRYERAQPGELVHVDVKKVGRIPDGGGWRAHGRQIGRPVAKRGAGFDYVHSAVDDHSRFAYSEILPDETGPSCGAFIMRAARVFATRGVDISAVITDNHWSYRRSTAVAQVLEAIGARHLYIRPHCPWQNGKVERFNRTLQIEWAYRRVYSTNAERTAALPRWLEHYNNERPHTSLGGRPPVSRMSPT